MESVVLPPVQTSAKFQKNDFVSGIVAKQDSMHDYILPPPDEFMHKLDQQDQVYYRVKKGSHDNIFDRDSREMKKESLSNLLELKFAVTPSRKKLPNLNNDKNDEKHDYTSLDVLQQSKEKRQLELLRKKKNVKL